MATTGLFDDLPDVAQPKAPATPRSAVGLFDDLPDTNAAPVTRPKSPDDRGLPISGPRPTPAPEEVGTLEGIASSARRGVTAGLRGLDALAAKGDTSTRPTMRQERQAFEQAMNDPAYQQKLIQAMGDSMQFGGDPQANTAAMSRVEATRGPQGKLGQIMAPARTAAEAREFDIAEATRKMEASPRSEAMKRWEAADNSNWWKVLAKDPVEIIANITAESLPQSLPGMAAGAVAGSRLGPGGAAVGVGAGSLAVEYANSLVDGAQQAGFDFRKEEDVKRFFADDAAVAKASEFALKRGVPIAVLDGLSASMAGKLVAGAAGKGVKEMLKAGAGEVGLQAAAGASGEALAQGVSDQDLSLKDIVAEAIGELASAPSEVATNVRGEMRRQAEAPARSQTPPPPAKPAEPPPVFDPKELERILRSNQVRPEPKLEPAHEAPAETKSVEPSEMAATLERLLRENEPAPVKPPESSPTPPKPPAGTELRSEAGAGVAPAARPSRLEDDLNDLQGAIDVIRKRLESEQSRTTPEVLPSPAAEPEAGAVVPVPPAAAPASSKPPELMTPEEWDKARSDNRAETFGSAPNKASASEALSRSRRTRELLGDFVEEQKIAAEQLKLAEQGKIQLTQEQVEDYLEMLNRRAVHRDVLNAASKRGKRLNAEAVEASQIEIPAGYVREGDAYIYKPEAKPAPAPFTKGQRVQSSRYGAGEVVRQIGKRYQVQFDDGTKFTVGSQELTPDATPLVAPEPVAEIKQPELPERTLDTMSEAIALSSPSGKMSKRSRDAANERLSKQLFGEGGLQAPKPRDVPEVDRLRNRAKELRGLAERGMKPIAYAREADALERQADALEGKSPNPSTTTRGDRITREREQKARDKAESEKGQSDFFEESLNKAIKATDYDPTKLMEGVTGAPVWLTKAALNTTLRVIRAAYRGGKALAAAIEEGIENLREQNIKGFDAGEARQWFRENVWENVEEGRLKVSKNRGPREAGESDGPATKKKAYAKDQIARMGSTLINGNALPREFRDARDWGLGLQRYFEENLRLMVEDTRKAIRAEFPKLEDRAAAEERLRQYWIGEADVSTVGGPAVQKAAASFRDAVDELTTVAVRNGLVPDEKKQTWLDNRGEWLRRTYLAFDPAADWNYDTLLRRKEAGDAEVTRIWNNAQAYLEAQNPQATPKQIEAAMRELIDRREAENALLGSTPPPGSGKRFAVDTGSLLRRKDLPLAIREWMGEIKDPFVRGLQSGKWMSQFITRNLVQRRFAKIGMKLGVLSETPEGRNFVELYPNQNRMMQKRDEEGNPLKTEEGEPIGEWRQSVDRRFEPLHGYYTSPEFKAALDEFNGTVNQMSRLVDTAELALRTYIGANRVTKWALVGMNPFSWSVNTVGGQILRLAAGGVNPISYKRAFSAIQRGNDPVDIDATEKQLRDRATYLLATKAGLTGKGIMQGDIQGSSEQRNDPEAWATGKKAILDIAKDWRAKGAWSRLRRSITDIAMKPGNMGIKFMDDVFRVSAFLDELELAKKAFPDWKHEKQVEWAAERASNVYQNYDKLPDALRGASQLGFLNTFVSFKVEMFRNAFWILRYAFNGIDSNNPALRRDGYKKLMAFTAMATLPFIAAAVSRLKFADDEDETFEDAGKQIDALQRWVVPPWDSGEEIFIMGREGNTWSYVPMGYLVPTYEVTRPLATLVDAAKEENGELALKRIMQGFASDYFGPGTVAGPAGEAVFNRTMSGGTVTEAEGLRGFTDRAGHAVNTFRPKIADPVFETYKATTGQLGNYGRKFDTSEVAWKLAGFRVRTVDVEKQLAYKMQDFSRRYSQAKSYSTKMERRNPGDADKVTDAKEYTKAKREGIREEYKAFHNDMTKVLGVSEKDFGAAQKEAGVPSELRAAAYQ